MAMVADDRIPRFFVVCACSCRGRGAVKEPDIEGGLAVGGRPPHAPPICKNNGLAFEARAHLHFDLNRPVAAGD
jgi:hypothetical protein